jgi:GH15 family glucan-1,4-alpha-glucosidase
MTMETRESDRTPVTYLDGYLPIEDHGLIGDGHTAALVGRDGAITWMCVPRFDSPPLFCGLLDARRGGAFGIAPDQLVDARQCYERDTAVLVTELQGPEGLLRLTDACLLHPGADLTQDRAADRGELLRCVQVLRGRVRVRVSLRPLGNVAFEPRAGGLRIRLEQRPELDLQLWADMPLSGLDTLWELAEGAQVHVSLGWKGTRFHHRSSSPEEQLDATRAAWRAWMRHVTYAGPRADLVRRSAITLKLLDYFEHGAMIAAPTSSLPEWIGGARNWDYRFSWIRDAAFSVYALRRIGLGYEASGFLGWVLDAVEKESRPKVLYTVDGKTPLEEREDPELEGYRGSRPVRWGNAAVQQRQHDVFGEILDCAYQWAGHGGHIEDRLWQKLCVFADAASREWIEPDQGIWEVRTPGRPFTYSAALCHVALDRAARIAEHAHLPGPVARWRADAEIIRNTILERAWDPQRNALTQHLGGGGLDASVLALPLRRVVDANHPRMLATTEAIRTQLSAGNGLLYRYRRSESPDGVPGQEGAFLLCSFWLVETLVLQGKIDEAGALFESLCRRATPLGLLSEQVEPATGAFLSNFPQAMSHVGLIAGAVRLAHGAGRTRGPRNA